MSRETHVVGFRVGRETYGVPIASLREIVRVPEITAVPDAPDYLEGIINLRGNDSGRLLPESTGTAAF
jgi:purine-binding chemotaxis protein CheW